MGPALLLSGVFLLGLLSPWGASTATAAVCAMILAFVGGRLGGRSRAAAPVLLVATGRVGLARSRELRLPAPEFLTADTFRLEATVSEGCVPTPSGSRCTVDTLRYGLADLHVHPLSCAAHPGDTVTLVATVRPIIPLRNPPRIDPDTVRVLRGIHVRLDASACTVTGARYTPLNVLRRAALAVRTRTDAALATALSQTAVGSARALLFGDTTTLDPSERDAFRQSGLAHLLAVSGAHVALLTVVLGTVFRRVLCRIPAAAARGLPARMAAILPLPCVGFFVLVTGESPSSLRALCTGGVTALATLVGRKPHGPSLVAGVAAMMAAHTPALVDDPGWQLSVVASLALTLAPRDTVVPSQGLVPGVLAVFRDALVASLRVAFAVTPVLALLAGRAPLTATLANVLAAPLGEVILLPGTLAVAALGVCAPHAVSALAGKALAPVLAALFALPPLALRLPLASVHLPVPTPAECVVATVTALGIIATPWHRGRWWAIAGACIVAALEIMHRHAVIPHGVLRVTALDVGQGDALVIDLPDGTAMLVDGGGTLTEGQGPDPGLRAVVPWLALRRRSSLTAVVLTHPHPDHAGGLVAVLQDVHVAALWDTGQGVSLGTRGSYASLLGAAHDGHVPILGPRELCGPARDFHGARLEVLAPCPGPIDGDTPNDASFVLRLSLGRASVLLPGDIEREGEARVINRLGEVTVLKVPHHGSRTSSTEDFLNRVHPRVAIVSCGHPSPFGHPHPEIVARYAAHGIVLRRTDLSGAVTVTLHPDGSVD